MLSRTFRCSCGWQGFKIDSIPLLLPKNEAALWNDSDSLVARFGKSWKRKLNFLGPKRFIRLALKAKPQKHQRRYPVSVVELAEARRASSKRSVAKEGLQSAREPDEPIEWLAKNVQRFKPKLILEVGCGGGFLLQRLGSLKGTKTQIVGIDKDFLCLKVSRVRAQKNCFILGANAKKLPFPDQYFDLILSNFGFWHIEDYASALKEAYRVLKADGKLIACEMNHSYLTESLNPRDNIKLANYFGLYGKVRIFIRAMKKAGFFPKIERRVVSGHLIWWAIQAKRPAK
ncbi:MAG: class I SAM-dependent methyltransferase [Elusimicrobia bacterium]|nr:class I SAM-dependent methyltransferase [Elusimicrobiota bacterium]